MNVRNAWRLMWACMLVIHAPMTWMAFQRILGGDAGQQVWQSAILLSASNIFFALELVFATSLRIAHDRRAIVVFLLVVAVLHLGVVEASLPDIISARDAHMWLIFTLAVVLPMVTLRLRRRLSVALARLIQFHVQHIHAYARRVHARVSETLQLLVSPPSHANRAPPVHCAA